MNPPSWWWLKCHPCIRRRVISHVLHTLLHTVRQPFFSHYEYGYFPDFTQMGWICFMPSPSGRFSNDLSVRRPFSVFHEIASPPASFPAPSYFVFCTICPHQSQSQNLSLEVISFSLSVLPTLNQKWRASSLHSRYNVWQRMWQMSAVIRYVMRCMTKWKYGWKHNFEVMGLEEAIFYKF